MVLSEMFGALLWGGHTAGTRSTLHIHIINVFHVSVLIELQQFKEGALCYAVFVCE